MIPQPLPVDAKVSDETAFFNWYNPAKAARVLTVSLPDPVIKLRVICRLIWWKPEQTIPESVVYPRPETSHIGIKS